MAPYFAHQHPSLPDVFHRRRGSSSSESEALIPAPEVKSTPRYIDPLATPESIARLNEQYYKRIELGEKRISRQREERERMKEEKKRRKSEVKIEKERRKSEGVVGGAAGDVRTVEVKTGSKERIGGFGAFWRKGSWAKGGGEGEVVR